MVDYQQVVWDDAVADDCRQLIRLAVREDLDRSHDLTTLALVPSDAVAYATLAFREAGTVCGLEAAQLTLQEMNIPATCSLRAAEGDTVDAGTAVMEISGPARDLLTAERPLLNFVGRLSGIATLTRSYLAAIQGTQARIYDTRKTTPGWRRLEKYAVHCGGGCNHRTGLFDAVLIKDNHLAQSHHGASGPAQAVERARQFLAENQPGRRVLIEVEVDTLDQLRSALTAEPDVVLLDNMTCDALRQAVAIRDAAGVATELEASGGIELQSIREVAEAGVDRISVGALTHAARSLDVGLDWVR